MSKEAFKNFIKDKPSLINYVNDGSMTWQKFYEIYDLYGEDSNVWNQYLNKNSSFNISKINDLIKGVDLNSIKQHIGNAQKALDLVGEFTTKKTPDVAKIVTDPRPLNKFFED